MSATPMRDRAGAQSRVTVAQGVGYRGADETRGGAGNVSAVRAALVRHWEYEGRDYDVSHWSSPRSSRVSPATRTMWRSSSVSVVPKIGGSSLEIVMFTPRCQ